MKKLWKKVSPFNNCTDMPVLLYVIKKILAFWVCYIAGLFIAEGLVIILHFAMGKNMLVGDVLDMGMITLIAYYGYIVIAGIALLYWKVIEKKPLAAMGLSKKPSAYFIGIVLSVFVLGLSVFTIAMTGNIMYHGVFENTDVFMIILLIGGFIIQGATEEILCRGIVLHALKERTSLMTAITISTVLFILPHWSSLFAGEIIYGVVGVVNLILVSVIFSFLTICFNSIWAACGFHSFWNAVLYSVLGLNLSGNEKNVTAILNVQSAGNNIWNGGMYGIEASIITTIVLFLASAVILVMGRGIWYGNEMEKNTLEFECTGIRDGGKFPIENTGRGKDISPEFVIKNLSPHARTFIITLEDLSHPIKKFTHWVIWNVPAADKIAKAIPPGKTISSPNGAVQGIGYGFHRYAGPKPPKGKSHRYCFTIYVLDSKINVKSSSFKRKVLRKASKHIIQRGEVCGYFE